MDDGQIDLSVVQLFDKECVAILDKSPGVHLYVFSRLKLEWEKTDIGGVLFVCERSSNPQYVFHVINRNDSSKNSTQPITSTLEILLRPPHIFYRTSLTIFSMWFCVSNDCKRIYELLKRVINSISFKEKAVKDVFFLSPEKASLDEAVKITSPGPNIRQLLSSASEEFERSINEDDSSKSVAPALDPSNSLKFHLSHIAMDAPPITDSTDCQFASDLERTLKEATTPKMEEAVTSIPVFSKKENEDKVNEELLRRLRNEAKMIRQDSKATFTNSVEGLTRSQLKAALLYMIENDDEFLTSIHSAYTESLNRRLHQAS
ncbi:mRNA decapping enzyme 1A [Echinococcus multilocularis]|uniref:mRNA decapping enzyme 1A n=1 Tax=Echinococcus multilocularis TaxID=6211 RepID=A0A068YMA8_ECHMU|nr:mRNA decapping enzyme 1A [Echinococcus multilocularis]